MLRVNQLVGFGNRKILDPDAEAYIARVGITDPVYVDAVRALVPRLKGFGIWTKLDWLHLYANESSAAALKNVTADDFHGSLVNAPAFAAGEGFTFATNKYALVDYIPATDAINFGVNAGALFCWAETAPASPPTAIGCMMSGHDTTPISPAYGSRIWPGGDSNNICFDVNNGNYAANATASPAAYTGFFASVRTASNALQARHNNTQVATATTVAGGLSQTQVCIGADYYSNGFVQAFFAGQISIAGYGGLTVAETDNLYTALSEYRTAVGL